MVLTRIYYHLNLNLLDQISKCGLLWVFDATLKKYFSYIVTVGGGTRQKPIDIGVNRTILVVGDMHWQSLK